jgi:hypothetical protein
VLDKQNNHKMKTCLFVSGLTLTFRVAEIHVFLTDSSWGTFSYLGTMAMVDTQQLRQCLGNLINVHFENIVVYLMVKVKH